MALAINVSSSSSPISTSSFPSSDLKTPQIGSLRLSDRINVSSASMSLSSGKRSSVKSLNVQSITKEAMVASEVTTEKEVDVVEVEDFEELAKKLETASPLEIMDKALEKFGNDIAIAFSGAEDVALIEYAHLTGRPYRVFSLDTGRLNPETYRLFDTVEKHYGIRIEYMFPDAVEVQALVRNKGLFSFYEDGHQECCRIRKVRPLRRALKGLRAWITGQRKDQSPGTRSEIPVVQVDPVFEGLEGGAGSLVKWNPVANVEGNDVWSFLRTMDVPVNTLHAAGYVSIGCEPCTRAVLPGQHEREGRWWWEDAKAKECGLHKGNIKESSETANVNGTSTVVDIFKSESVVSLSMEVEAVKVVELDTEVEKLVEEAEEAVVEELAVHMEVDTVVEKAVVLEKDMEVEVQVDMEVVEVVEKEAVEEEALAPVELTVVVMVPEVELERDTVVAVELEDMVVEEEVVVVQEVGEVMLQLDLDMVAVLVAEKAVVAIDCDIKSLWSVKANK